MYLQHFGFTAYPFDTDLKAEQLYRSASIEEVAKRLEHLIELRGIALITGEAGCGKTTACRQAVANLHRGLYRVCYASLTTGSVLDTLNVIACAMALPEQRRRSGAWHAIRSEAIRLTQEKKQLPVLIIDEAHHLRNEVLEDLRELTNFELDSQRRMCMLLVGLTELRRRLAMSMHESLAQRIVTQHHFAALTSSETEAYLWHRLQMAGAAELPYFEPNAIEALFNAARGMPRQINRIAHYALLAACLDKAQQVSAEHVEKACAESRL